MSWTFAKKIVEIHPIMYLKYDFFFFFFVAVAGIANNVSATNLQSPLINTPLNLSINANGEKYSQLF